MTTPRPCLVEAVIRRPLALPWIVHDLPIPDPVESWPGYLLDWRWTDRSRRLWVGLVRCQRDGPACEHAVSGELLTIDEHG